MKQLGVYRIATYLLVLFCAGHTAGGMLAQKSLGPRADEVFASMKAVHFDFNGGDCTYYGFWFAFGLTTSVFLLFSAVVAWSLDRVKAAEWAGVAPIAWAMVASHAANAVLSWRYFFAGPGMIATAITVLVGIGALRGGRARHGRRASPRPPTLRPGSRMAEPCLLPRRLPRHDERPRRSSPASPTLTNQGE